MGQEHAISIDTLLVPRWLKSDWLQDPHMIGFTRFYFVMTYLHVATMIFSGCLRLDVLLLF